jgi:hypothetical protein
LQVKWKTMWLPREIFQCVTDDNWWIILQLVRRLGGQCETDLTVLPGYQNHQIEGQTNAELRRINRGQCDGEKDPMNTRKITVAGRCNSSDPYPPPPLSCCLSGAW